MFACVCVCVKDTVSLNRLIAAAGTSYTPPSLSNTSLSHTHYRQPLRPILPHFPPIFSPSLAEDVQGVEVEDGGERGPLKQT